MTAHGVTHSLAARVRDRLRTDAVDPVRDREAATQVVRDIVHDHERRSLAGRGDVIDEPDVMVDELVADISGLGPLQPYLDDPQVEEIWINAPDRVFIARHGRHELTSTVLDAGQVEELIERMLRTSGRRLDVSQPFVDATLPGGHRLHVVLGGIARDHAAVNIRKFVSRADQLADLVTLGTLTTGSARFLAGSVAAGLNVVVSGGTQAGKTTLLNCLMDAVPGTQRVVSCEEVHELRGRHPDWVPLQTRSAGLEGTGAIGLRDLVRESLRMRPSRIVIGEVRGAEALDLLLALNSGLPGMASIHANSARQALTKLCTLPLLAGENVTAPFVVPTVAASVDLVVHTRLTPHGARRVTEVVAVTGRVENGVIESEPIFTDVGGTLKRASGRPNRPEAFRNAGLDLDVLLEPGAWER